MNEKEIKFAPAKRFEGVRDIAEELLRKTINFDTWFFASDESSLFDFPYEDVCQNKDEVYRQIKAIFGVDVSDIEDGNLVRICERIKLHRSGH